MSSFKKHLNDRYFRMLFRGGFRSLTVMGASLRSKIFSYPDLTLSYEIKILRLTGSVAIRLWIGLWSSGVWRGKSENRVTSLLRTVCVIPGEESNYIFSKFDPLNTDTPLLQTPSMGPSVTASWLSQLGSSGGKKERARERETCEELVV